MFFSYIFHMIVGVRGNYIYCLVIDVILMRLGGAKVGGGGDFYWRPPSHKKLAGELTPQLVLLNYLPVSASFGVKRVMHYITFFVIKTS